MSAQLPMRHDVPIVRATTALAHELEPLVVPLAPVAALLPTGWHTGDLCELSGASRLGKTQICLHMAALVAAQGHGVAYIDSSGSFDHERVRALLAAQQVCAPVRSMMCVFP